MPITTLKRVYKKANSNTRISVDKSLENHLDKIADNSLKRKAVLTIIITLGIYKVLKPSQDIRKHQDFMQGGFSGRSFDTKYITPTLMKMGLPHMAESGWLTRSFEQPRPYDKNYPGKISIVKKEFLEIVDFIQGNPNEIENVLSYLLRMVIKKSAENKVKITPILNPDKISISLIIAMLKEHFETKYKTSGGAKLPVIAFHSIYEILTRELGRFAKHKLIKLGSHTASDRTSGQSGDIQVCDKKNKPFESIEIKLDIPVSSQLVIRAKEKIYKTDSLARYYILSSKGVLKAELKQINKQIMEIQEKHGCQVIVNGLYDTLKYYLRMVANINEFLVNYAENISKDNELQPIHKKQWSEILDKNNLIQ